MGVETLSVNFAAAQANVKAVRELADSLSAASKKLESVAQESVAQVFDCQGTYDDDQKRIEMVEAKILSESLALSASAKRLLEIAQAMKTTAELFREENLERLRQSSAGVMTFDGGMDTMVFGRGTTISGS